MKKVILILVVAMVGFTSCKKEVIKPSNESQYVAADCNCGEVIDIFSTYTSKVEGKIVFSNEVEVLNICTKEITIEIVDKTIVRRGDIVCFN